MLIAIARGLLGIAVLLGIAWLLSEKRKHIDWKLVGTAIGLQLLFAVLILKVSFIENIFKAISKGFVDLLNFSQEGAEFLFGGLVSDPGNFGFIFAFQILPTIVFFSALTSTLYYLGVLQRIVKAFAWIMARTMRLSGAESLAAAANIFIGQTEAPLVIKPYLEDMTRSEIFCLMTGGMATIAGSVLFAYVSFMGGADEELQLFFAKHFLMASIMSAPAAIAAAKMIIPEDPDAEVNSSLDTGKDRIGKNLLDAISNGTTDGVRLAVNVGAMLLVFTAMIAMVNYPVQAWLGEIGLGNGESLNELIARTSEGKFSGFSLQYILGIVFSPLAWVLGVESQDILIVGQLLGEKTILNEFYAYKSFSELKLAGAIQSEKSIIVATYALCGFANFASIGIQIGGIGALAPGRRVLLSQLGIKALVAGSIASFLTGAIAGMILNV